MKILVIQKKMIGDILMSSVLFKQLRKKFPGAELHYLISRMGYDVVSNHPLIAQYIFFDDYDFKSLLKKIRHEKYDYIIDAYGKTGTAMLCGLSASKSISFCKKYSRFFYTHTVKRSPAYKSIVTTNAIEHRLQLLEPLQIAFEEVTPDIFVTEEEKKSAAQALQNAGVAPGEILVMVTTFGSNDAKTYPLKFMAEVIEQVARQPVRIILNHRKGEEEKIEQLTQLLSEDAKGRVVKNLSLDRLRSFINICSLCRMLIGNEGGATNISKALHVPTFSIFAPFVGKEGWFWGENGTTNVSVHVSDYIEGPGKKNYENFSPVLFQDVLQRFLSYNLNDSDSDRSESLQP